MRSFTGSLLREVVDTAIRVTEIQPGMVETEFSIVRFRGDKGAADKVYEGLQPRTWTLLAEPLFVELNPACSSGRRGHRGGDRLGCVSSTPRQHC